MTGHTNSAKFVVSSWAPKLWVLLACATLTSCGLLIGDPFANLTRIMRLQSMPGETCILESIAAAKGVVSNSITARADGMPIGGPGAPLVVSRPFSLSLAVYFKAADQETGRVSGLIDVWSDGTGGALREQGSWLGFSGQTVRALRATMIAIESKISARCGARIVPNSLRETCDDGGACPR